MEEKSVKVSTFSIIPVEGHDVVKEIHVGKGRAGSTVVKKNGEKEAHASKGAALKKYNLKETKGEGGGIKASPAQKKGGAKKTPKAPVVKKTPKAAS